MGFAVLQGLVTKGLFKPEEIGVFDPSEAVQARCKAAGFSIFGRVEDGFLACKTLLLAVKPQMMGQALAPLAPLARESGVLVVSLAAGISTTFIQSALGAALPVVRTGPNTPLLVGYGATTLCRSPEVSDEQFDRVCAMFEAIGLIARVEESQMDTYTPVNGSSPAFVYRLIGALEDSAVKRGVPRDAARTLICSTVIGSAHMVLETGQAPADLTAAVCSPGGATLAALASFDQFEFERMIDEAFEGCVRRAGELGQ